MDKKDKLLSHSSRRLVGWLAGFLLGVALLFALFYFESSLGASFFVLFSCNMARTSFSSSFFSAVLDPFIWGALCFGVMVCLFVALVRGGVSRRFQAVSLVLLACLASSVLTVFFGLLNTVLLVPISVILLALCIYSSELLNFSRVGVLKCALLGVLLSAFAVEAVALITYNLPYALNLPVASSSFALHSRIVELSLANMAYPILPYIYLVFILLGVAAYLWEFASLDGLSKKLTKSPLGYLQSKVESLKGQDLKPKSAGFPLGLALVISFALSVFFVAVTQFPWINPSHHLIAVDAPDYYQLIAHMRSQDAGSALQFALKNDRSAFMLLSYTLSFAFPKISVIMFMPALLVPVFTLASLYLVRFVCGFHESWLYVVLIAPFSIQALGLIYSGYFANLLAAVFVYLYFALLLKFRGGSSWSMLSLCGVSLLVLFSHSWTWYVFVISLAGFLLLEWRNTSKENPKRYFKWEILTVALSVVVGLAADYARTLLVSKSASGVVVFETASSGLSMPNADFILSGLHLTANFYLGGVFSNALLLGLSLVGFLFMLTYKSASSRLLISWFVVGCVAILFASGEYVFNRFMFLMPSLVFSALGLVLIVRYAISHKTRQESVFVEAFVVGLLFLFLLNFALGYISNINII